MKYTHEERLEIGRRIYTGEISKYQAAAEYEINYQTARNYMRIYRDTNHLPAKSKTPGYKPETEQTQPVITDPDLEEYESMTKEDSIRQQEYQVILELSGKFPVKLLCKEMGIERSSFYYWKQRLSSPAQRTRNLISSIVLFQEYHLKYPSHGYRWLNAKIRLDTGLILSDPYAHKCCKIAGIKSQAKHYRYKKPGDPFRIFPNLLSAEMVILGPLECIVSDMTAFRVHGIYYELTLYMDLWNNEIVAHALSAKRGDRMTYISGLNDLIELKKEHPEYRMILHSDQGSVYASKAFNELLPMYHIDRSMSRAGTPTDNAAMEAINGWIKAELFMDFHVTGEKPVEQEIDEYITFFNEQRPAYSLGYLTPKQYKESLALPG